MIYHYIVMKITLLLFLLCFHTKESHERLIASEETLSSC